MEIFLNHIFLLSILGFILGLIKPNLAVIWNNEARRKDVLKIYGTMFMVSSIPRTILTDGMKRGLFFLFFFSLIFFLIFLIIGLIKPDLIDKKAKRKDILTTYGIAAIASLIFMIILEAVVQYGLSSVIAFLIVVLTISVLIIFIVVAPLSEQEPDSSKSNINKSEIIVKNDDAKNSISESQIKMEIVNKMNGREFEYFLKALFEKRDYNVEMTPEFNDQGADLIIEKFGEKTIIQAKRYKKNVGNKAIQEVVAAKNYYEADYILVITNSYFTKSAKKLATSNDVNLWNYDKLEKKLRNTPVTEKEWKLLMNN